MMVILPRRPNENMEIHILAYDFMLFFTWCYARRIHPIMTKEEKRRSSIARPFIYKQGRPTNACFSCLSLFHGLTPAKMPRSTHGSKRGIDICNYPFCG
jgi:hypothetical protein